MSTTTQAHNTAEPQPTGSTVHEQPSVELEPWVEAEPAPLADCCGAIGCLIEEFLVRVEIPSKTRVLCPDHAAGFIRQVGGVR